MPATFPNALNLYDPFICRICVQGALDQSWVKQVDGLSVSPFSPPAAGQFPVTILFGQVADQAALMGVLNTLYSLGLPLVSVECMPAMR